MDWWHKIRRVWVSVSSRVKPHKSGGGGGGSRGGFGSAGGGGGGDSGLLKLRDDVRMCGYGDVQVMWNMLSSTQAKQMEATADGGGSRTCNNRSNKQRQRPIWRFFFWTNHGP